jgi:haloalkane dehalogenase
MTERLTSARAALPSWLPASEWPLHSSFLRIGKHTIHCVDEGQGPPILFVHTAAWSLIWRDVITLLRPSFRCVTFDFPGTGLSSPAGRGDVSLAGYARLLEDLGERLGLTDVTLVMHDLGAPVGVRYASRHPERIKALVVTQGFGWPPGQATLRFALRLMGSALVREFDAASNIVMRLSSGRFGVGRHLTPAGRKAFTGVYADRSKRRTLHHLMRDSVASPAVFTSAEQALRGPLAAKPMMTIFGERNDPFGFQQRWKQLFPHAIEHVVAGGNHFPMTDDPQLFATAVRDFAVDSTK